MGKYEGAADAREKSKQNNIKENASAFEGVGGDAWERFAEILKSFEADDAFIQYQSLGRGLFSLDEMMREVLTEEADFLQEQRGLREFDQGQEAKGRALGFKGNKVNLQFAFNNQPLEDSEKQSRLNSAVIKEKTFLSSNTLESFEKEIFGERAQGNLNRGYSFYDMGDFEKNSNESFAMREKTDNQISGFGRENLKGLLEERQSDNIPMELLVLLGQLTAAIEGLAAKPADIKVNSEVKVEGLYANLSLEEFGTMLEKTLWNSMQRGNINAFEYDY